MDANIAARIAASNAAGSGNYFKPGFLGVVEVIELKTKKCSTKKRPTPHDCAIAEFKVISSNGVHPVGTTVSIMEEIDEGAAYPQQAASRVKAMVLAVAGVKESDLTNEQAAQELVDAFSDGNPRKFTQLQLETFGKNRTPPLEPITKYKWGEVVFDPHAPVSAPSIG